MRRIALLCIGLSAFALAGQDAITLRRTLVAGTVDTYRQDMEMKMDMDLPNMGPMEMNMKMVSLYTVKIGTVTDGVAKIESSVKTEKFEMDSPMGQMPGTSPAEMPTVTIQGTLDSRNRMVTTGTSGVPATMVAGFADAGQGSYFLEFPEGPVKIGDSWDMTIPKNAMMKDDQKLRVTLTGEKEVEGKPAWVVSAKGILKTSVDTAAMAKASGQPAPEGMSMKIEGEIDSDMLGVVDKATGRTIRMTTKLKAKQKMDMAEMGLSMTMNGTGHAKFELVPAKG
jgi:hypothetical protein